MKKLIFFLVALLNVCFMLFTSIAPASAESTIAKRLAGRIVLQVEDHGEAWYINPVDYKRYYLGSPDDAFNIMRYLGLGITDKNLAKVPGDGTDWSIDEEMIKYVNGRILLQVERAGDAWYVSPINLKRYSLGTPAEAFQLMSNLGLGITNNDLEQIEEMPNNVETFMSYSNYEYGFGLELPETWEGYSTRNRELDWGDYGKSDSIDFGFAGEEGSDFSIFNISIHNKEQSQKIQASEGPKPALLGENSDYVFGYGISHEVGGDETAVNEIESILRTFEYIEMTEWNLISGKVSDTCSNPTYSGNEKIKGFYVYDTNYVEKEWFLQVVPEDATKIPVNKVYDDGSYNNWLLEPKLKLLGANSELETKLKNASAENPVEVIVKGFRAYCEGLPQVNLNEF